MEFVKIDKERAYTDYMNFCFEKCRGLLNKDSIDDIRFRLNGLYEKMNKILIKINHMNCLEDKKEIMKELEIYLKVIENKDLSKVEAVKFETKESTLDQAIYFFFHKALLPIIVVVIAQRLI